MLYYQPKLYIRKIKVFSLFLVTHTIQCQDWKIYKKSHTIYKSFKLKCTTILLKEILSILPLPVRKLKIIG